MADNNRVIPKQFYVVQNREGFLWAGYNQFTRRPWQAKFYSDKRQAEKTAERCKNDGAKVVRAKITIEYDNESTFDCSICVHRAVCPAYEVTMPECKHYQAEA